MKRRAWLPWLSLLLAIPVHAWEFSPAVEVAAGRHAFHHLDASGRAALAVAGGRPALAWDDQRDGTPRCHFALDDGRGGFRTWSFGQGECYAPGVAALADGRFALVWEDEAGVHAALAGDRGVGTPLRLAAEGGQGNLAARPDGGLSVAWSSRDGRWRRVWRQELAVGESSLRPLGAAAPADAAPPRDDQTYPALAASAQGMVLVWEDRRHGHTVVFASRERAGVWSPPSRVSQNPTGRAEGDLGRGTGAMRPAVARFGDRLACVWLDKRDFLSGYDVYAAFSDDGGASWGRNQKVQDSFGDSIAQWHAAAAGNGRGELVVAWDDERDGTADVWLAVRRPDGGFGDNLAPPVAAGPDGQSDPAIVLDPAGDLHLAWIERLPDDFSRLRYSRGRRP